MLRVSSCSVILIVLHLAVAYTSSAEYVNMGILHTVRRFTAWHAKEESLSEELKIRLRLLKLEIQLLQRTRSIKLHSKWTGLYLLELAFHRMLLGTQQVTIMELLNLQELKNWIGYEDLFFAMMAWVHLTEVSMFSPKKICEVLKKDSKSGYPLNASYNRIFGVFALTQKRHQVAVYWLRRHLFLNPHGNMNIVSMEFSHLHQCLFLVATQQLNRRQFVDNLDSTPEALVYMDTELKRRRVGLNYDSDDNQFKKLCQGNKIQSPQKQMSLKCHYERRQHPYLYINPVKVEHLSSSPPLYQFYEIISNSTISMLKEQNSEFVGINAKKTGEWRNDIGTKCGFNAGVGYHGDTPKNYLRMSEILSGLKFLDCELHGQYAEYTYGRMYQIHNDHSGNRPDLRNEYLFKYGDYMATILYYLEVPTLGGETSFVADGVVAYPIRGSAILWYNMYRNGTVRNDCAHGSCPVIHGEKIVTTHFFRYNNNWDTRKCLLHSNK